MFDQLKQPVKGKVAKVPVIMQLEALECGAACLAMILAYYGKWVPLEEVRETCGVSRDGSSAINIVKAARYYGLNAGGAKCEPEAFKEQGSFPCIIHWDFNHFVVLNGVKGNRAYINDPARGSYTIAMDVFDKSFTGICLEFEPGESFVPSGKPKSVLSFAKKRLRGTGTAVLFAALVSVITASLSVLKPGFDRVFLDRLLTGKDPGWVMPFIIILAAFNIITVIMTALNSVYSFRITGKMAAVGNTSFMWQVLKKPMKFFSQRMAGDIASRRSMNAVIASSLISTLAPLLINGGLMFFYLAVMLRYSVYLTLAGIAALLINSAATMFISKKSMNIARVAMRDAGKLYSCAVSGIEMIETIKASGAENGYFKRWSGFQANVNTQNVKYQRLNEYLGMIPELLSLLSGNVILIGGVYLTMRGQFTPGMVLAFQGFLTSFMAPAMTFVSAGRIIQEMRTQMERVEDVMEYPEDNILREKSLSGLNAGDAAEEARGKLSGNIELKNVTFGYAPLSPPLIENFNLTVNKGQSIAIAGASGCGKSTMSKLISGLYEPMSGEILFDGKPLSSIPGNVFRSSVAVVDQDIILFEDTIANNIKMWDNSILDFEMILAARDAQIHDDIMKRPGGYQHKLIEGGKDFSGGQRQRIEIARAIAQDPTILILDEATSALDAKTEHQVIKAVRDRGITTLIIAHRLSAIRSCDLIIVMDNGKIIDRGTHRELMERCALYRELVTSE